MNAIIFLTLLVAILAARITCPDNLNQSDTPLRCVTGIEHAVYRRILSDSRNLASQFQITKKREILFEKRPLLVDVDSKEFKVFKDNKFFKVFDNGDFFELEESKPTENVWNIKCLETRPYFFLKDKFVPTATEASDSA